MFFPNINILHTLQQNKPHTIDEFYFKHGFLHGYILTTRGAKQACPIRLRSSHKSSQKMMICRMTIIEGVGLKPRYALQKNECMADSWALHL